MRVGIVGDLHLPFTHPRYLEFCRDIFKAWGCTEYVLIGDVVDHHALSFWDHDPDGHSANDEAGLAIRGLARWVRQFPVARVCVGNHDARHIRTAKKAGIPTRYLRNYKDIFNTPGWDWQFDHRIEGVLYEHGTNSSGKFAAYNRSVQKRTNLVMGHCHHGGGVLFNANDKDRIFSLQVGCGIDLEAYAFAYGQPAAVRPTLGCGVVIDGSHAFYEPMPIGRGEYYRRTRRR